MTEIALCSGAALVETMPDNDLQQLQQQPGDAP
jgi:hypothetical protein